MELTDDVLGEIRAKAEAYSSKPSDYRRWTPGDWITELKVLRAQQLALIDEIERLRGVVAKLPVTKDGVPVTPDGEYFWRRPLHDGTAQIHSVVASPEWEFETDMFGRRHSGWHTLGWRNLYSTRERAESARKDTLACYEHGSWCVQRSDSEDNKPFVHGPSCEDGRGMSSDTPIRAKRGTDHE